MTTVTVPFQLQLRGLLHGFGQTWEAPSIAGLGTRPVRTDDRDRPGRDGTTAGRDLYGGRTVIVTVEASSDVQDDLDVAVAALKSAWARSEDDDVPLEVWVEGGPRVMYGRPRGAGVPYELDGVVRARCEFYVPDGLIYGSDLHVAALPPEDAAGGVVWPADWPAAWGASATGIVDLDNVGGADAPVLWTIIGPKVAPTLHDVDRGVALQLTGTVPDGSVAVVDTGARTVELDGVDRWSWVTGDSGWPHVAAGGGRMRETSTSGAGASSVAWRDTYE